MESTITNKPNVKMVVKSISVPDHLWHQVNVQAAQERKTLQVLVAEALEAYLEERKAVKSHLRGIVSVLSADSLSESESSDG